MAAFYLDHDVARSTADELRARGHAARTAHDLGLDLARDDQHLLLAAHQGWILVTHNRRDFMLLHGAWQRWFALYEVLPTPTHAGILVIRQGVWTAAVAATELDRVIRSEPVLANRIYEWTRSRGWVPALGWEDRTGAAGVV